MPRVQRVQTSDMPEIPSCTCSSPAFSPPKAGWSHRGVASSATALPRFRFDVNVETWSLMEEAVKGREADVLPPPWAVLCEGREREEVYLVGQPLNQCTLINKRSNSSK